MTPDIINALFEGFASVFIANHIRVLWQIRQAYGISLLSTVFFSLWGAWNIFYYPHLGQLFSFYAGIMVMVVNIVWIFSILHLRRKSL